MDAVMIESPGTTKKCALKIVRKSDKNQFTCAIPDYVTEWISNVVVAYFSLLEVLVNVNATFTTVKATRKFGDDTHCVLCIFGMLTDICVVRK
jgi:hypothetical protein